MTENEKRTRSGGSAADRITLGRFGEEKAAERLASTGYRILARNYRCRLGELDLVAQRDRYIVFVEVKLRKNAAYGTAAEFVTAAKQRKVLLTAQYYLQQHPSALQPRFDVVEVYAPAGTEGEIRINHIENAFP